jgi:hypothetical protein
MIVLLSEVCQLRPRPGPELIAARPTLVRIGGRQQTGPVDLSFSRVGWDR